MALLAGYGMWTVLDDLPILLSRPLKSSSHMAKIAAIHLSHWCQYGKCNQAGACPLQATQVHRQQLPEVSEMVVRIEHVPPCISLDGTFLLGAMPGVGY
jgi:hypothetical protein